MSASSLSTNTSPTVEEQLDIALQRAAIEDILSASGTYLTACVAIYGWDFILTFPDEYKTMWKADRWTSVRAAFFLNRREGLCEDYAATGGSRSSSMRGLCSYWGLLVIVYARCLLWLEFDPKTCDKIHLIGPAATTLLFLSCQFLLGARVWVMWDRRKWIAWFFGTLAICSTALQILAFTTSKALPLLPGLRGSTSTRGDKNDLWVYWLSLLLYDTIATIFMLMCVTWISPAVRLVTDNERPLAAHWGNALRTRLLSVFVRDGILYFIIVFICNLVNVIYFSPVDSIPGELNPALKGPLSLIITTIMASRIVLHLRSIDPAADSRERDGSDSNGHNNVVTKVAGPDTEHWAEEGLSGGLEVSYAGVMVTIETVITVEKKFNMTQDDTSSKPTVLANTIFEN